MADYRLKRNVPWWNIFMRLNIIERIIFEFQNPKISPSVYDALPKDQKKLFEEIPEEKKEENPDGKIPS